MFRSVVSSIVVVLTSTVGCSAAAEMHEHPEDLSVSQITADLLKDSDIRWKRKFADVKVAGKMFYDWGRANELTQPADEAFWPITITFVKEADGSQHVYKGCAVYSCPPGATGPWRYNRFWFQDSDLLGVAVPSKNELRSAVLKAMRSYTEFWFLQPTRYVAIREVTIPEDPAYEASSETADSWDVVVVADRTACGTRIDRVRIRFRAKRGVNTKGLAYVSRKKVGEEILSSRRCSRSTVKSMPNLGNRPFDKLLRGQPIRGSAAPALQAKVSKPPPQSTGQSAASAVDRTNPAATAKAGLTALRARNLATLAEFCTGDNARFFGEIARQGESHSRYRSIFSGWRWEATTGWNGETGEVRFRDASEACVKFADLGPDEIAVVTLECVDGRWCWEDIHSPSQEMFDALSPALTEATSEQDRSDDNPTRTAKAFLEGYRQKDLTAMAGLCTDAGKQVITQIAAQGAKHPRYRTIFAEWRWRMVNGWDGQINAVKYPNESVAVVGFAPMGRAYVAVVTLKKVGDRWCVEDVNRVASHVFNSLSGQALPKS